MKMGRGKMKNENGKLKTEKQIEVPYELPIENSRRTILVFEKYKTTDNKYPRNYNVIKKQ